MTPQPDIEYPVVLLWSVPDSDGNTDAAAEARALISMGGPAVFMLPMEWDDTYTILRLEVGELPSIKCWCESEVRGLGTRKGTEDPCTLAVALEDPPPRRKSTQWLWHALENGVPL